MESAVRSPWIKSAITTGRARNDARLASQDSKIPGSRPALAVKTLPRGTDFLDAETGGQKSTRETARVTPPSGPSLRSRQAIIFRLAALCIFAGRRGKLSIISGDVLTAIPSSLLFSEARRQTALLILKSWRPASSLLSERAILSLQPWCTDEQSASLLS